MACDPFAPAAEHSIQWPHSPIHRLSEAGVHMLTAGTYQKLPLFHTRDRMEFLTTTLLNLAAHYQWKLQAWAVFPNHYHLVAEPSRGSNLRRFVSHLHTATAAEMNRQDSAEGRKVWFQFWDSRITFPKSFFARLNYVHQNAVHHGLVRQAEQYPWCSAGWSREPPQNHFD